jgi:hypothetical protein
MDDNVKIPMIEKQRIIMLSIIVEKGEMFIRKDEESNFTYFTSNERSAVKLVYYTVVWRVYQFL